MHGRIPRLVLVTPIVAVLALTVMASRTAALGGAETPALKSISSRLDGTVSTVLIEASEPVAYLTSQPDPLTVLVDLRNVNVAGIDGKPVADMLAPVSAVGVESAIAPRRRAGGACPGAARSRRQASRPQLAEHDPGRARSQRLERHGRHADDRAGAAGGEVRRPAGARQVPQSRRSAPPRPSFAPCDSQKSMTVSR